MSSTALPSLHRLATAPPYSSHAFRLCAIVLLSWLFSLGETRADDALVLPKGRASVAVENLFYFPIERRWGPHGNAEDLAAALNDRRLDSSVLPLLSALDPFVPGGASIGDSSVRLSGRERDSNAAPGDVIVDFAFRYDWVPPDSATVRVGTRSLLRRTASESTEIWGTGSSSTSSSPASTRPGATCRSRPSTSTASSSRIAFRHVRGSRPRSSRKTRTRPSRFTSSRRTIPRWRSTSPSRTETASPARGPIAVRHRARS